MTIEPYRHIELDVVLEHRHQRAGDPFPIAELRGTAAVHTDPNLHSKRPGRLSEPLVTHLLERIIAGQQPVGTMLPTEPELEGTFGVSRTVVRQALKSLEGRGLVAITRGRGTEVQPPDRWSVLDADVLAAQVRHADAYHVFDELSIVRSALESELAELAAINATDEQIVAIARLVSDMEGTKTSPSHYLELDLAFHDAILEASGNRMGHGIMRSVSGALRASREMTNRIPGGSDQAQRFHEAIYLSTLNRDPESAHAEMRSHVRWSWRHYRSLCLPAGRERGMMNIGQVCRPAVPVPGIRRSRRSREHGQDGVRRILGTRCSRHRLRLQQPPRHLRNTWGRDEKPGAHHGTGSSEHRRVDI